MSKIEKLKVDTSYPGYDRIHIMSVIIKNKQQINGIRKSCQLLKKVEDRLMREIRAGVATRDIERRSEQMIKRLGAIPAFKGVYGPPPYPATTCISINEEVVHGIPSKRILEDGDLVSLDCGLVYHGFYSDAAFSVVLGEPTKEQDNLMKATRWSMFDGIDEARPGNTVGHISYAIQSRVESMGCNVVKVLFGHGVGVALHEDPPIYNFGKPGEGAILQAGMIVAIETMVVAGNDRVVTLDDKWTVVTDDKRPACHFEETVLITKSGPEILTRINYDDRP